MKLYFSPGACSLSPHIVLREAGFTFDLEQVNLGTKETKGGEDFKKINPKGYVPALKLDDGTILTEGPAIVQYLADQKPESRLAPPNGTMERVHLQEWLNFVSTELHKSFSILFNPSAPDEFKGVIKERLAMRYAVVDDALKGKQFLMGDTFTVADAYLFVVSRWTRAFQMDLATWPNVKAFFDRVRARPAVKAALDAEGQK